MAIFEDLTLEWQGKPYVIRANDTMRAIAKVEDVVTFGELFGFLSRQVVPVGKVSMAYGALLRHAGCRVTDEEVYRGMFKDGGQKAALDAIEQLMVIMTPPVEIQAAEAGGDATANPPTTGAS